MSATVSLQAHEINLLLKALEALRLGYGLYAERVDALDDLEKKLQVLEP